MAALRAGELEVALVRDRPPDQEFDAVLVVEEPMGVILATDRATALAEPGGVQLHRLTGLRWIGFPRSDSPAWYDQVTATLRGHGIVVDTLAGGDDRPVIAEVKLAAVGAGNGFALASPGWARPLPDGMAWYPLIGNPIVRRTWAVWFAASSRRDLGALIDALDLSSR
jgi:DNA-binding transcriptional LysR family regulator